MSRHIKTAILCAVALLIVGIGTVYVMGWWRPGGRLTLKTVAAPRGSRNVISPRRRIAAPAAIASITPSNPSKFAFGPASTKFNITNIVAGNDRLLRRYDPHAAQDIPVINAALRGNVSKIAEYLDSGGNPNLVAPISGVGNIITPLIAAISVGQRKVIEELIARGANVNFNPGGFHNAPLVLAAAEGETDVVRSLLNAGANINQIDGVGRTPIAAAVSSGNYSTVKLLLDQGAEVSSVLTPGGHLPVYVADSTTPNYVAIKKLLLAHGVPP